MKIKTKNLSQTKKIAEKFAKEIINKKDENKTALVVCLKGDLGSGKTSFVQGFAKGLKIKEKILSPTFILMNKFKINFLEFRNFYHFDCYRIEDSKEMRLINFFEVISNPENIVIIEWPEKIKDLLPKNAIFIEIKINKKREREIFFMGR